MHMNKDLAQVESYDDEATPTSCRTGKALNSERYNQTPL